MGNKALYISTKQTWLRLIITFVLAGGAAALLCIFVRGPQLGILYDFLLARRPALPIAREILLIDTVFPSVSPNASAFDTQENILEPMAVVSLLMTMSEFDASTLIIQAPILGLSTGSSVRDEEIRYRFDREFGILNRNIRNLFDAIRIGAIPPGESSFYVGELVELSERGKERLVDTLISRDEEGIRQLEQAAAIFGNVSRPGDLLVQVIRSGEGGMPGVPSTGGYSRARPDRDGGTRRAAPISFSVDGEGRALEHIIFSALKTRYKSTRILEAETGKVLVLEDDWNWHNIPLDLSGALLFEVPRRNEGFRRLPLSDFLKLEELEQNLRLLLGAAEAQGIYTLIQGEENPLYLYDYVQALRTELLKEEAPPEILEERKILWKKARARYFSSLDNFLNGPSEMFLVTSLEVMRSDSFSEEEASNLDSTNQDSANQNAAQIIIDRDLLIRTFGELRRIHKDIRDLRTRLEYNLADSLCILGPCSDGSIRGLSDTEVSALLANSIITGSSITPGSERWLFLSSLGVALLTALILCHKSAAASLWIGLFFSFLIALGFSLYFMFSAIWLDPQVPIGVAGTVTLVSFIWALVLRSKFNRFFRTCFGPFIAPSGLKHIIASGVPGPRELITLRAAVVAIRNSDLLRQENEEYPKTAAAAILSFREKMSKAVQKAGGMVAGNGGDLILACFGSPLERVVAIAKNSSNPSRKEEPAIRAAGFVSDLLRYKEGKLCSFGLDFGLCAFTWSPLSGYSVFGGPVLNARDLSNLGEQAKILITTSAAEALPEFSAREGGVLKKKENSESEAFFELLL
jgi:hypothetical protein